AHVLKWNTDFERRDLSFSRVFTVISDHWLDAYPNNNQSFANTLFRPIKTDTVCDILQVQVALINVSFTPLRQNPPKPQFVYVECSAISPVQHMARMAPIIKTLLVPSNFDGGMYF